jgi:segregation and condensation protein B
LLFVSGEALPLDRIAGILELKPSQAKALLDNMAARLLRSRRGLLLRELDGRYQLCTRPELARYVNRLFEQRQKQGLSQAAYETLSIVAYNTNVTRALVEKIRGVNSDSPISKLLDRRLIAESGRASLPGRPMTYDVTDEFYRLFGFKSKKDLPDLSFELAAEPEQEQDVVSAAEPEREQDAASAAEFDRNEP